MLEQCFGGFAFAPLEDAQKAVHFRLFPALNGRVKVIRIDTERHQMNRQVTPLARKLSTLNWHGTQTSSIRFACLTHSSGIRSVSSIVKPILYSPLFA